MKLLIFISIFISSSVYAGGLSLSQEEMNKIYKGIYYNVKVKNPGLSKEQLKKIADEIWYLKMNAEYDNQVNKREKSTLDNNQ